MQLRTGTRARFAGMLSLGLLFALGCGDAPTGEGRPPETATQASTTAGRSGGADDTPKLVILLSIDTLRADHLGVYGYDRATSPTLDAFAREGVVFEDASATSPWTLPSHASMLTGRHPTGHGIIDMTRGLPVHVPTLAQMLARGGWKSAAVVNTTYLKRDSYQVVRGFDEHLWVEESVARRSPSTWVTDQAMSWIREFGDEKLFLFVHYYDVHSDYSSLPEHEARFVTPYEGSADGSTWQLLLANLDPAYLRKCIEDPSYGVCAQHHSGVMEAVEFDVDDIRHLEELYDAGIHQMDAEFGRLIAFLRESGRLDETLFIITSDHGEEFMEHGGVEHTRTQYQEMLHVPLMIRGPGVPAGARVATAVSIIDIVPTVLARLGIEPLGEIEGLDLAPLWRGEGEQPFEARALYGEAQGWLGEQAGRVLLRSIRRGDYKLHYDSFSGRAELYDLPNDPLEQLDIAAEHPEKVAALVEEMTQRYHNLVPSESEADLGADDLERLRALGYMR